MTRVACVLIVATLGLGSFAAVGRTQVRDFEPVTDDELLNPDPGDWINWRRTLNGQGYSPLDQINRDTVRNLQLVWSWATQPGTDEVTPLVHDGVMYVPSRSGVQAIDAATGDFLWEHTRRRSEAADENLPINQRPGLARRNIAIYNDKIFAGTSRTQLIALDARTGDLVWEYQVADDELGYRYTSGPIIVQGKVVAGITGCERYKNDVCFISAHDPETGTELWRTSTVARPGEPGGDTWGDLPLTYRAGADAWIPGSYDPDTDLIYWSTAQPKPWASAQRGTEGAALYSNSTLALDPETGAIRWYFQHIPAETHDLDEVFEIVIVDRGDRRSLFKMGKIGVLWELDPRTGAVRNTQGASISRCRPGPGGASPGETPGRCSPTTAVSPTTCSDRPEPARSSRSSRCPRTAATARNRLGPPGLRVDRGLTWSSATRRGPPLSSDRQTGHATPAVVGATGQ